LEQIRNAKGSVDFYSNICTEEEKGKIKKSKENKGTRTKGLRRGESKEGRKRRQAAHPSGRLSLK
jgi:hypothetical protein